MPRSYGRVFEEVDLALRRTADAGGVAVQNELLASNQSGGYFQPPGLHRVLDQADADAGEHPNSKNSYHPGNDIAARYVPDKVEHRSAQQASDESAQYTHGDFFHALQNNPWSAGKEQSQ